ncbi:presqualene diphosphate synthase HpnD [Azospirillum sp. RWY-5-1]|uniref:Presqualene diphosphate synthase HpnD n=1 Tax=Azospirillum oleiclasticum TaxID=2735135 RepID=A0ABX2TGL8_9PROT|nr:presqualene diphosphate synthase HpnD [Azospirillum oleiclasticum]NYZ16712.1 presqualene diphosphate synthase HpnD [Azospirillum oleiclasticum]NYZ23386.1 presqualene diphosphate synthase HpnD [Azospirillum oleiclasticum]
MTAAAGEAPGIDPVAHVTEVVRRSGSSFTLGMRILPRERREAMFAIYAFCREVDDVADEPNPDAVKLALLADWRREIDALYEGRPGRPTTRALAGPVRRFGLPKDEFVAVIDGMEMDVVSPLHAPDMETLRLYCRRVAGAVGLLSLHAFGAEEPEARGFAVALGEALQLTNILRDVEEDAGRDRLYLPGDLLRRHGIDPSAGGATGVAAVLAHPGLDAACRDLAAVARARFAEADRALASCARAPLRPALLMMGIYEDVLNRLERRGWHGNDGALRVGKASKLWAALAGGLLRPPWRPPIAN